MARYIQSFNTPLAPQQVMEFFASYMQREGFEYIRENNEDYYKKGHGLMTGPQYLRLTHNGNHFTLEAWIKFAVLPGVYCGEMGIDGAVGAIPKKLLKDRVTYILNALKANPIQVPQQPVMQPQHVNQQIQNPYTNNAVTNPNAQQPNVQQKNPYGYNAPQQPNVQQKNPYGYNAPQQPNVQQNNPYGYNAPQQPNTQYNPYNKK